MRTHLLFLTLLTAAVGMFNPASAYAAMVFSANLDGSQAAAGAGTGSAATGTALLTLNDAQTRLEISITINGIDFVDQGGTDTSANDATIFHIHRAAAGTNGPVVFGFIGPNSDTNNDLVITPTATGAEIFSAWDAAEGNSTTLAAEIPNLLAEGLYFNLHTTGFGGGEIRGQITAVPEPTSLLLLSGILFPACVLRRSRRALV